MLIIRGGINSKKRELCPTALALSAFYYNKNKHADTYIMYLHAYSTASAAQKSYKLSPGCGHDPRSAPNLERHGSSKMQTFNRKKCSHFSPTNIPSAFPSEISKCGSCNITYQRKTRYAYCGNSFCLQRSGSAPPPFYFASSHATVSKMIRILSI